MHLDNKFYVLEEEDLHGGYFGSKSPKMRKYKFINDQRLKILIIGNSHGRDTFNIFDLNNNSSQNISLLILRLKLIVLKILYKKI